MKQRDLTNSTTKTESVVRSYDQLLLQECCTTPRVYARGTTKPLSHNGKKGTFMMATYCIQYIIIYVYMFI